MEHLNPIPPEHVCTSHAEGLWVVFKCKMCPSYERRINLITGDTTVTGLNQFSHGGVSVETEQ